MRLSHFQSEQWLPRSREEVFAFFSAAENLDALTPPWLGFQIVSPRPIAMHRGTLIDYRLRIHGLPIQWRSEITSWQPPHRFVDEQRRGPYRVWHHEHRFEERDGGTLAIDQVDYAVLGGWLIEKLFVRGDVEKIFEFRRQKLLEIFKAPPA